MPKLRTVLIAGTVGLLTAGTAVAATAHVHTMKVDLPDGSVARISYTGDVAPRVQVLPTAAPAESDFIAPLAFTPVDDAVLFAPFAHFDQIFARLEQQHREMIQRVAQMDRAIAQSAGPDEAPRRLVATGNLPAGTTVHYSFYSSTNGKDACSQTIEWRSDGSGKQPQITRTSSGDCDSVKPSTTPRPAVAKKTVPQDEVRQLPGNST